MNARHDADALDRTAALALGCLGAAEGASAAAHLAACADCAAEYRSLRAVADLVGLDAEAEAVDPAVRERMRERLLAAIRAEAIPKNDPSASVRPSGRPRADATRLAFAACLLVAIGTSFAALRLEREREHDAESLRAARRDLAATRRTTAALDDVVSPSAVRYAVPNGQVVVIGSRLYLVLRGVPPVPAGRVLQAWTRRRGETGVRPSVTFAPTNGETTIVRIPLDARTLDAVAVSVEPVGGSAAPTTKPRFLRPLV